MDFLTLFAFLASFLLVVNMEYIFARSPTNSLMAIPSISSFILPIFFCFRYYSEHFQKQMKSHLFLSMYISMIIW